MTKRNLFVAAIAALFAVALSAQAPDRSKPPAPGPAPALKLPAIQKRQLTNGLPVWLVELHEVPVAQVNLVVTSGSASDPAGKYGIANFVASMLAAGLFEYNFGDSEFLMLLLVLITLPFAAARPPVIDLQP